MARKRPKKWQPETSRMIDGIEWITAAEFRRRLKVTQVAVSRWYRQRCPLLDVCLKSRMLRTQVSPKERRKIHWLPAQYVEDIKAAAKSGRTLIERHGERWVNIPTFTELAGVSVAFVRRHIDPPVKKKRTAQQERKSGLTLDVLDGRTIRRIEARVIIGLKCGSATTRYYLAEEDAITIRKKLGSGGRWMPLREAAKLFKVCHKTLDRYCKSRKRWRPDDIVIEYDIRRWKNPDGNWPKIMMLSRKNVSDVLKGLVALRRTPAKRKAHWVDGVECLITSEFARRAGGLAIATIHAWNHHPCAWMNGETLEPLVRGGPMKGRIGAVSSLWRAADADRINKNYNRALSAGYKKGARIRTEWLTQAADDQPKANEKTTPPPPAKTTGSKQKKPRDKGGREKSNNWIAFFKWYDQTKTGEPNLKAAKAVKQYAKVVGPDNWCPTPKQVRRNLDRR